jgi:RNA polymerase sigma factor (sigma-70 family)
MSPARIAELAARYQRDRDGTALEELVRGHFDFLEAVCRRHARIWRASWRTFLGAAFEGFEGAVRTYDPARGAQLSTFAWPRILGAMTRATRRERRRGLHGARAAEHSTFVAVDLDALATEPTETNEADHARLGPALEVLSRLERAVIRARYFDDTEPSFDAVGARLGFSRQRAHQLERQALGKLARGLGGAC